ncbi:MAG: hypothetical protein R3293_28015, partial [Candidatus Promineifilaceae bacterium]|nr:hypothetical protein [Candidatus Promineifilaceae bacterium]
AERDQIVAAVEDSRQEISQNRGQIQDQIASERQILSRSQPRLKSLDALHSTLAHVQIQGVSEQETLIEMDRNVREQRALFDSRSATLREEMAVVEQEIERLNEENDLYISIQSRLHAQGYDTPVLARQGLVDLETRFLSLRAAEAAANSVLTTRRNVDMGSIYEQIAGVWGAFTGREGWQVHIDAGGIPIFNDVENHQFDLSQFSGGEKTALLVILHTIIAQHFSETDFMLIDEPLEHLDAVNRRSLIRFLIQAYRSGRFRQAIVATFEESLIRKYMSDDDVNVIHL